MRDGVLTEVAACRRGQEGETTWYVRRLKVAMVQPRFFGTDIIIGLLCTEVLGVICYVLVQQLKGYIVPVMTVMGEVDYSKIPSRLAS